MSSVAHWSEHYLGDPWVAGSHDCWGFFKRVQREVFGVVIREAGDYDGECSLSCARALSADHLAGNAWVEVDHPSEGDAVLLARGAHPTHVGVWVGCGAVLHCQRGAGVVLQDLSSLQRHGWGQVKFYRKNT